MTTYTTAQYIKVLQARSKEITNDKKGVIFKVASAVHADKGERIFTKGKNDNNSNIGTYSTKPIRISAKNSPVGLGAKTKFFQGGYKQFKSSIGRGSKVNLKLFGDLEKDFNTSLTWNGKTWVEGAKRRNNANKIEWMDDKYGNIWGFTKKERKTANDIYKKILINTMQP